MDKQQDLNSLNSILLDMKETDYNNTLALTGLIELMLEKNIISMGELKDKTSALNAYAHDTENN